MNRRSFVKHSGLLWAATQLCSDSFSVSASLSATAMAPTWPLTDEQGKTSDRARLKTEYIDKYKPLIDKVVQVHMA
jgi:hypothetical protein